MKPLKILSSLAAVAVLGGVFSAFLGSENVAKVSASDSVVQPLSAPVFNDSAIEAQSEDFKVSVQEATTTSTSQAYTLKFMSSIKTHSTGTAPYSGVHIVTDDSSCPVDASLTDLTSYDFDLAKYLAGDKAMIKNAKDWIEADEEGNLLTNEDGSFVFKTNEAGVPAHDYKTKMPVYEGYVYELNPSDSAKNIIIPNYINRSNRYYIKVTSIGTNVFNYRLSTNSVGEQVEKSNLKAVRNIFIGNNITSINEDAFKAVSETYTGDKAVSLNILGDASSRDLGTNWSGNAQVNWNYDLSLATDSELSYLPQIYDDSDVKDKNGNTAYFDEWGAPVDSEGNYLDKDGNQTGEKYDGVPMTQNGSRVLTFNIITPYVSESSFAFGDAASNRPMVLEYSYKDAQGTDKVGYYEFPLKESEGIGNLAGNPQLVKYVDIHKEAGDVIDSESLVVRNIFKGHMDAESRFIADTTEEYYCNPSKGYKTEHSIDNLVKFGSQKVRKFGKYTSFTVNVDKVPDVYKNVNPSSWSQYKNKVENGEIKVRYSFVGFNASSYEVTYVKNGELTKVNVPFYASSENGLTLNFYLLTQDKNNAMTFLLKNDLIGEGFNAKTVKKVEYKGVSFKMDLMNTKKGTTQVVTKSDTVVRFGYIDIFSSDSVKAFDADAFLAIMEIAYVAVYLAAGVGYYFFAKNKYKNDEFRRMNTRKYIKEAAIGFVGGGIIYSALLFIILRFGLFNVSVVVYNPLDPLVMIFGIVAIVVAGLFIKKLVTSIKVGNERRKAMKLKLNEDVADDGTK